MKVFIDHFRGQNEFVKILKDRIKSINQEVQVSAVLEFGDITKIQADEKALKYMNDCEIIIPIITSDYLSNNEKEINDKLIEISDNKNKYLLPIIYSPSNWSSINWIVKSKVYPKEGFPLSELSDNQKEVAINELVQTIENIIVKTNKVQTNEEIMRLQSKSVKEKVVFISHDHDDSDFAELLKLTLQKQNISVWLDNERLKVGQDWREEIDEAIKDSIAVIAIMTPEARKSEYVTYEWAFAWGKGKQIFPLMLKQTPLHPRLESLQYLDFTNRVSRPWDKLVESINELTK